MSNHIMDRIWWREDFDELLGSLKEELPGSGRVLKWVLISLADNANDQGYCWPSIETIAQRTMLTERSVQRAIKQAIRLKIIRRHLRRNNSSQYIFNLDALPQGELKKSKKPLFDDPPEEEEQDLFAVAGGVTSVQDGDDQRGDICAEGVNSTTKVGDRLAPKPSVEPPIEEPPESLGADAPDDDNGTSMVAAEDLPLKDFIAAEWKKLKADFPEVGDCRRVTDQMVTLIKQRTKEHRVDGETDHDLWRTVFERIRSSKFLTGRVPPVPPRTTRFHLTLSWLLKPHLFREVINGKYTSSRADDGAFDPSTGEVLGPAAAATRGTIQRLRDARQRPGGGGHPRQAGCSG